MTKQEINYLINENTTNTCAADITATYGLMRYYIDVTAYDAIRALVSDDRSMNKLAFKKAYSASRRVADCDPAGGHGLYSHI